MPLSSMRQLLSDAASKNYAVGAFNVINMETTMGVIAAAEELCSPIILQVAEPRLKYAPLEYIAPLMVTAAKNASVPVCVHLDHAESFDVIESALNFGFTSVMFDGSRLKFDENVELTKRISELAHSYDADCEGEIGCMGMDEANLKNYGFKLTEVIDAKLFAERTAVDAMAVAIGNQHGFYKEAPNLNISRLSEIHKEVDTTLVLHGGSGLTELEFKTCIENGVRKINVATAIVHNLMMRAKEYFDGGATDYFKYHELAVQAAAEATREHIKIFGSSRLGG